MTTSDPDLTLADLERFETHHREGVYLAAQSIEQLLSIARAHIEGREQVGELVERLRNKAVSSAQRYPLEEPTRERVERQTEWKAADALTVMQAEIERLRRPFRGVDSVDWEFLFDQLGDGGRGKFWKAVFNDYRGGHGKDKT